MGKYVGKYLSVSNEEEQKKAKNKKKMIILLVCLAVALAALIGGIIYYNSVLNQINRFDEEVGTLSSEELDELLNDHSDVEDVDIGDNIGTVPDELDVMTDDEALIGNDIINILLIGQDTRNANQRGLSDSMILVSINKETKKLVMTSFMRDLYIDIPASSGGYYRQRINTAYAVGGMPKLNATLEHNFGVEIDNNIEVDFTGFKTIVDALGGVDIELNKAEASYLNKKNYSWGMVEGINHLNGEQALEYSRIRKIDSDFYRTGRQRTVLNKIFDKVKNASVTELLNLAKEFLPLITTDMTNSQMTKYIMEIAPLLPEMEIVSQRVPIDGSWWGADVGTEEQPMYVIYCNLTKNREMLRETIGVISE